MLRPEQPFDERAQEKSAPEILSGGASRAPVLKEVVESAPIANARSSERRAHVSSGYDIAAPLLPTDYFKLKLIGLFAILVVCIFYGRSVALIRAQTTAAVTAVLAPNSAERLDVQVDVANEFESLGEHQKANEIYSALYSKASGDYAVGDLRTVYLQLLQARSQFDQGAIAKALPLCTAALNHIGDVGKVKKADCPPGLTSLLYGLANKFDLQESGEHIDVTLPLRLAAVSLWQVCPGTTDTKSNVEASLARLYEIKKDPGKALEHWVNAYRAYKGAGYTDFNCDRLYHMGINLVKLGRSAEAVPVLEKALRMMQALGNTDEVIGVNFYLGVAKSDLGKYAEAMSYLGTSMGEMTERDDGSYWAAATFAKGRVYAAMGDTMQARHSFEKTLSLLKKKYQGPTADQVNAELRKLGGAGASPKSLRK